MAKNRIKIFYDSEFTDLSQNAELISIGFITEHGNTFYAEFNDYDTSNLSDWIEKNVINNLLYNKFKNRPAVPKYDKDNKYYNLSFKGTKTYIKAKLIEWLKQFGQVEIWSDCLAYDWVLFCQLFGHAFNIPKNVYYIPFDISTLFKIKGIDPDLNREKFVEYSAKKHNALDDAIIIKMCYEKLLKTDLIFCKDCNTECDVLNFKG